MYRCCVLTCTVPDTDEDWWEKEKATSKLKNVQMAVHQADMKLNRVVQNERNGVELDGLVNELPL